MACKHYQALFWSKWSYSTQKSQNGFFQWSGHCAQINQMSQNHQKFGHNSNKTPPRLVLQASTNIFAISKLTQIRYLFFKCKKKKKTPKAMQYFEFLEGKLKPEIYYCSMLMELFIILALWSY